MTRPGTAMLTLIALHFMPGVDTGAVATIVPVIELEQMSRESRIVADEATERLTLTMETRSGVDGDSHPDADVSNLLGVPLRSTFRLSLRDQQTVTFTPLDFKQGFIARGVATSQLAYDSVDLCGTPLDSNSDPAAGVSVQPGSGSVLTISVLFIPTQWRLRMVENQLMAIQMSGWTSDTLAIAPEGPTREPSINNSLELRSLRYPEAATLQFGEAFFAPNKFDYTLPPDRFFVEDDLQPSGMSRLDFGLPMEQVVELPIVYPADQPASVVIRDRRTGAVLFKGRPVHE